MKKLLLFILVSCSPFLIKAQCGVQLQVINATCNGSCDGSATAFPYGGTGPYTFLWAPGGQTTAAINGLCAGSYTVSVLDAVGCAATAVATITEPTPILVSTSPTNASCSACCDGFITSSVTGGTPPYTYTWSTMPAQTTPTAQALCPGTYTLCVTDANGCLSCVTSTVNFTVGIQTQQANGNLSVYPNPATNSVNIRETFGKPVSAEITLTNMLGETIISKSESATIKLDINLDISSLPNGVYFVAVKTSAGSSIKRIIKQ